MHTCDDLSIEDTALLIRAVRLNGLVLENDSERLSSLTFKDSRREISCFVADEVGGLSGFRAVIRPKLEESLAAHLIGVALIQAGIIRECGLWIERRPTEFEHNDAHVVICAPASMGTKEFDRAAKQLASNARFEPDERA